MTQAEAISCLSEGHTLWSIEQAKDILKAVGAEFTDDLILKWKGQKDANPTNHPKGLWLNEDKPGQGVESLRLSNYVVNQMGLNPPSYIGRGFQAQGNATAIREALQ
jgi:hypothetical protein